MPGEGFGSQWILDKAITAWSCRAIFKPYSGCRVSKYPLDILHDRQGGFETKSPQWTPFVHELNNGILDKLQKVAADFDTNSGEVLCKHFPCPWDDGLVIVAHGSPNASYGYFYLAVCLMRREDAPAEKKTEAEASRERRLARERRQTRRRRPHASR